MNTPLLFESYKKTIDTYDEVIDKSGEVKPYWATYFATLERVGMDELGIRIKKSSISLRKTGLHITYMMLRKN
jgi:uncharacterized circularly permuted ATP-grasp superfamily protein